MNLVFAGARDVSGRCLTTLLVLARFADDETGVCWPGMRAVSVLARQSLRSTVWAIDELRKAGWLEVEKKRGRGGCNRYTLALVRLEAESVRMSKRPQKAHLERVQKPMESLRNSCGRSVENPVPDPVQSANSGNGIIKEYLGKGNNKEKTEAADAGYALTLPVPDLSLPILEVLASLSRSIEDDPRARGAPLACLSDLLA
jgi:hypothetical protein